MQIRSLRGEQAVLTSHRPVTGNEIRGKSTESDLSKKNGDRHSTTKNHEKS